MSLFDLFANASVGLYTMSLFRTRCSKCKCCAKHTPCTKSPQEHLVVFSPTRFILSTIIIQVSGMAAIIASDVVYYCITGHFDEFSCIKGTSNVDD